VRRKRKKKNYVVRGHVCVWWGKGVGTWVMGKKGEGKRKEKKKGGIK
jgi:hypothetical protein